MSVFLPFPPSVSSEPIVPVFLPFAGCPHRCVFCAQDLQTGASGGVEGALTRLGTEMARRRERKSPPCGIAFYGGTFTMLPEVTVERCLSAAAAYRAAGECVSVRCSTRPDAVGGDVLGRLRAGGLDLVELGVQSFSDEVLAASGRGYPGAVAERGCRAVVGAGIRLGIQLLPGLPRCTAETFLNDVGRALSLGPSCLRFYPCLVVRGTALAEMFESGGYEPWTIDETVSVLGEALSMAWHAGVPVIRLSVAPEAGFERTVIAGPRHPTLGNMIQGEALHRCVTECLGEHPGERVVVPPRSQGCLFGHGGAMAERYASLGLMIRRTGDGFEIGRDPDGISRTS